jgi:hypothetical protein
MFVVRPNRLPRFEPTVGVNPRELGCRTSVRVASIPVADLPIPELVENRRRSVAMLPPGAPALDRYEALELLEQLKAALLELRNLRSQDRPPTGLSRRRITLAAL